MDKEQAIRDEILVLRAQMGEADALAALVQGWQPRLWAFARVLTGDDEAAWDVMQDVWVAMLRDLRRLGAPARFRPWVFRIVRNKSADRIRGADRDFAKRRFPRKAVKRNRRQTGWRGRPGVRVPDFRRADALFRRFRREFRR